MVEENPTHKDEKGECYIFDLDETLSKRTTRQPLEFEHLETDVVNLSMAKVYISLKESNPDAAFYIITPRDERFRERTETWLKKNGISFTKLFMKTNPSELEVNYKIGVYKKEIAPFYIPTMVFDNNLRCCEMFKTFLGLPVCRVV